jgi:uncharacterized protein (DUF58 family)
VSDARDPGPDQRSAVKRRRRPRRHFSGALRWLRPPRQLRPTRAGWSFFALTFGIGFAALNTGNNLLYLVLSLMLAFLVLSGVLSESALRGVALRRRVPRELYAESDAWVSVEIHNQQRRVVAYALVVEDRWIDDAGRERAAGRCFALRIGPGAGETRSYRLCPERRGELAFAGFIVSTRFPFGLFSKSLTIDAPERALVYPAVDPVPIPRDFGGVRESGEGIAGPRGCGAEVGGVREYQRGDPARRIAWRASLRSRALWVRAGESEHQGEVEVRLRTADRTADARFERDVRGSASEVAALLAHGLRVGLRTDREHLAPGAGAAQRARLLGFLARVRPDAERGERDPVRGAA